MAFETLTDEKIQELLTLPKAVKNPKARKVPKSGHDQVNYNMTSVDGTLDFKLYVRQNKSIAGDFSCGINWRAPGGEVIILRRYNGNSHIHTNRIEETEIRFQFHIHEATQRYIAANKSPEGYAEATTRYSNAEEALGCLIQDCNVMGLDSDYKPQDSLFD